MKWNIDFFDYKTFKNHVARTMNKYSEILEPMTLERFNSNIIDPIKLTFDSKVYGKSLETIIAEEISRQRDKSNNNAIGYFHQNMFSLIKGCVVPKEGFDMIYKGKNKTINVELKNKHNTMNSSSSQKTYMRMQHHLLQKPDEFCYLVEVIAVKSQNVAWKISLDKTQCLDERIRRVSIDKFYEEITGDKFAFKKICDWLPIVIDDVLKEMTSLKLGKDMVLYELSNKDPDLLKSLYLLAFETYEGFKK